jgi:hypothetical protein
LDESGSEGDGEGEGEGVGLRAVEGLSEVLAGGDEGERLVGWHGVDLFEDGAEGALAETAFEHERRCSSRADAAGELAAVLLSTG